MAKQTKNRQRGEHIKNIGDLVENLVTDRSGAFILAIGG